MKDFDVWNTQKKKLEDNGHETIRFREGEIWWCSMGINIGEEQDGNGTLFERPVLIIK